MNPSDPVPLCLKRATPAFVMLVMLALCLPAYAQLSTYEYYREINTGSEGWYRIPLSPEVLARTKSGMNDLRIYSITAKDTTEIAYLQQSLGDKRTETAVPSELVKHAHTEQGYSYITLKFPSKKRINEIILDVTEKNFDKWIKVQGSADNKKWTTIRERARIVGFDNDEAQYRYTRLKFAPVEYSYFRLVMNDEWTAPITVTGAHAYQVHTDEGRYEPLKVANQVVNENKQLKATEIYIDLAYDYHVDHLVIEPGTKEDFYRNINVYRHDGVQRTKQGAVDRWALVSTGIFTSLGDDDRSGDTAAAGLPVTILPFNGHKTGKIKIEIINKDDLPVKIGSVKLFGETQQLVSKLPEGDLVLAFGKPTTPAPEYDLVYFRQNIPATLNTATLGEEKRIASANEKKEPKKALIEDKIWLWAAMGAVLLIIILFAMNMLRKSS